eukprot:comp29042_c0_seq1/m.47213 comp29042_c0_seq1/g.47213  ORF comp29042_c0_seq1/g.47213 comp29042_c0_seq1/m.47213 type:complete len:112 (+) comp29042_c0_seq1:869-1204(+)
MSVKNVTAQNESAGPLGFLTVAGLLVVESFPAVDCLLVDDPASAKDGSLRPEEMLRTSSWERDSLRGVGSNWVDVDFRRGMCGYDSNPTEEAIFVMFEKCLNGNCKQRIKL